LSSESNGLFSVEFNNHFKIFHELMSIKVREILLVSSLYDAFIMEEDGSLASRIINEYRGLNLSLPPRITRTDSAHEALSLLSQSKFDMVITMPRLGEMDAFVLGLKIKQISPDLPVILLSHSIRGIYPLPPEKDTTGIDKIYIWSGNSDLLLALVKNTEDRLNIDHDTQKAMVRVLVLVEDSPVYYSTLLPLIYKEIVRQTQAVLGIGLNEEHLLLRMRSRPKILLAVNYEEALDLVQKYKYYLFGMISDTRFPREGNLDNYAGSSLLTQVRKEIPDLPLLLMSSDPNNRRVSERISAAFLDKNSSDMLSGLHDFFLGYLGFGDFVFRMPDGKEIDRASDLHSLELKVSSIPDESLIYHASRNHFSSWLMARSEIALASTFRKVQASEFGSIQDIRDYLASHIRALRKIQQKGVVAQFKSHNFDAEIMDFLKTGDGSLGGKARGLAFMSALLQQNLKILQKYDKITIRIPQTLVITTQGFESFIQQNNLQFCAKSEFPDEHVRNLFLNARMPDWITRDLQAFLHQVHFPLSVRSSSLLEDAHYQPYAGLYHTYMIPNNHPDVNVRIEQLVTAVKLVYASTYYENPRSFTRHTMHQSQEDTMAVIIQQIAGEPYGDYYYPAISGLAQSYNFYPFSPMRSSDGIARIALGFGKTVVEGEQSLCFCPGFPHVLPQFSTVNDILANAQRSFYALNVRDYPDGLMFQSRSNLEKRGLEEAETEFPVQLLASAYIQDEDRIRDSGYISGPKVLTFASILKYKLFPLPELLKDVLEIGQRSLGCQVEIEFSVNLGSASSPKSDFYFLQMRPMAVDDNSCNIHITPKDEQRAICLSHHSLGCSRPESISDIIYVRPENFKPEAMLQMAEEIGRINSTMTRENRSFLLIGPGRWGSADRWLGIPVQWRHISGVGAIIELQGGNLNAAPSQGSHFFQNITSLGIPYITIANEADRIDWTWIQAQPVIQETAFVRHVRLHSPLTIKIDSNKSLCAVVP